MTNQHLFLQLVKQDMKRRKRRRFPRQWRFAYLATVAAFLIVAATYTSLTGNLDVHFMWYFAFVIPFAAFGITIGLTAREWKNNTVGWWLALPFSRRTLVASKFCAGLIRGIIILFIVCVVIALFGLYVMLLNGDFRLDSYFHFLKAGLEWFVYLVSTFPFLVALGILYAVIRHSRARPAIPLFWVFWGLMWSWLSSVGADYFTIDQYTGISLSITMFYPVAASWILAYLLIRLSAYLLDRQLAL